jgi:DNA polymerase III epsilon subunit-like protein
MLVTIFDTETTGLPSSKILENETLHLWPHVVQFSYIVYDTKENTLVEVRDFIIKLPPGVTISKESTNIHGITQEMTREKGVEINSVLAEFVDWCDKSELIIGHNVEFDYNIVCAEFMRLTCVPDDEFQGTVLYKYIYVDYLNKFKNYKKFLCTMKTTIDICKIKAISRYGKEYNKFPSLLELHRHLFGTEPKNLHNSLVDVIVCFRCFYMVKFGVDIVTIDTNPLFKF